MGTDICICAEKRSNKQWQFIGSMVDNEEHYSEYDPIYRPESLYNRRNYSLFAILADVRNGFMEDKYEVIAPRRGFPGDLSYELNVWSQHFQHSERPVKASWLTLKELLTFDWHRKKRKKYALVDERVASLFSPERSFPFREWPQGIACSYSITSKETCNASWTETYAEAAGQEFMELLNAFAEKFSVSGDVRFVFWFY